MQQLRNGGHMLAAFRMLRVAMFVLMVAEEMGLNQVTHLLAGRGIHKIYAER